MYETYRMLAHEHELDLEREARKRSLGSRARRVNTGGGTRHRRRKNLLKALILGFAAAAIVASAAQARVSDRTQALRPDDRSGIRVLEPTVVTPDLSEIQRHVTADEIGSRAGVSRPDDRAGGHGPGIVRSPELVTAKGGGFDWADASIGAGAALGFLLLVAGATTLAVRGRRAVRSARVVVQ